MPLIRRTKHKGLKSPFSLIDNQVREYSNRVARRLRKIYPQTSVKLEWPAMSDEARVYSPRVDIAIGPFATVPGQRSIEDYDEMMDASRGLIEKMLKYHLANIRMLDLDAGTLTFDRLRVMNRNARCFMAIEIENTSSRKHLMGSAINAAALGRIGVAVAWHDRMLKSFLKMRRYLNFLKSVDKNTFDTTNLIILHKDQFLNLLQRTQRARHS